MDWFGVIALVVFLLLFAIIPLGCVVVVSARFVEFLRIDEGKGAALFCVLAIAGALGLVSLYSSFGGVATYAVLASILVITFSKYMVARPSKAAFAILRRGLRYASSWREKRREQRLEAERPMRERKESHDRQEKEVSDATEDYERGMRLVTGLTETERRKTERKLKKDLRLKIQRALGVVDTDDSDIEEEPDSETREETIERLQREFNAGMDEVMRLHKKGVISEEERDYGIVRLQQNLQRKIGDILGIDVS